MVLNLFKSPFNMVCSVSWTTTTPLMYAVPFVWARILLVAYISFDDKEDLKEEIKTSETDLAEGSVS